MLWHISKIYLYAVDMHLIFHTYIVVCLVFKETILVLWEGLVLSKVKVFLISIVLLTHSTLFFAPP